VDKKKQKQQIKEFMDSEDEEAGISTRELASNLEIVKEYKPQLKTMITTLTKRKDTERLKITEGKLNMLLEKEEEMEDEMYRREVMYLELARQKNNTR